jgi:hypothetical protein
VSFLCSPAAIELASSPECEDLEQTYRLQADMFMDIWLDFVTKSHAFKAALLAQYELVFDDVRCTYV